jgi:hypothetical protein
VEAEHDKALVDAKAKTAAPGSAADVERAQALWHLLRGAATSHPNPFHLAPRIVELRVQPGIAFRIRGRNV